MIPLARAARAGELVAGRWVLGMESAGEGERALALVRQGTTAWRGAAWSSLAPVLDMAAVESWAPSPSATRAKAARRG